MKMKELVKGVKEEYKEKPVKYLLIFVGSYVVTAITLLAISKRR